MNVWRVILLVLICFVSCKQKEPHQIDYDLTGKVVRIADGDTFTLLTEDKQQVKIRMYGIDCPEKAQDFGQVARQKLSDLIFGKQVFADEKDKDRYGRIVAIVYDQTHKNINEEMLRSGLAWHYTEYDSNRDWDRLQEAARNSRSGLWSQPNPTPPWNWRKEKRMEIAQ